MEAGKKPPHNGTTFFVGVGQVGFWSSQAKSNIFENQNFKLKYLSSQILAKSSRVKY